MLLKPVLGIDYDVIKSVHLIIFSLWALSLIILQKTPNSFQISAIDIFVLIISIYVINHFFYFSPTTIYDSRAWLYLANIFCFFILKTILKGTTRNDIIYFVLILILLNGTFQCILALLQYFDVISYSYRGFQLLGTFSTPNHLASYASVSFLISLWLLLNLKKTSKTKIVVLINLMALYITAIILSQSRSNWLALGLSVILLLILFSKINRTAITYFKKYRRLIFLAISLTFILLPLTYFLKPDSVKGRLLVSEITVNEILKTPLKGHGILSFAGNYNKAKAQYFISERRPWEEIKNANYEFSPLNDYLLIGFELGIPMLLMVILLIIYVINKTPLDKYSSITLVIFFLLSVVALFTSILQNPFLSLVLFFSFSTFIDKSKIYKIRKGFLIKGFYSIIISLSVLFIFLSYKKGLNTANFYNYSKKDTITSSTEFLKKSNVLKTNKYQYYYNGKTLFEKGFEDDAIEMLEEGFTMTAAPKIGRMLAKYHEEKGNLNRAEEIYSLNAAIEPYRYEAKIDLINLFKNSNQYQKLIDLSKEIIELPIKIPSEKIKTYKAKAISDSVSYSKMLKSSKQYGSEGLSGFFNIGSKHLKKKLSYRVYLPPVKFIVEKLPAVYINDGFNYMKAGKVPELLDSLIINKKIEPIAAIFLEPRDLNDDNKNIRNELFWCNSNFEEFFRKELIPTVEKRFPVSKNNRTILGVSFGGLAAAYLAKKSNLFKNVAMQSPAFKGCKNIYAYYAKTKKDDTNMFLSYGTKNDTQIQDEAMIKILNKKGYDLCVEKIDGGGHTWKVWVPQLPKIFKHFYGTSN